MSPAPEQQTLLEVNPSARHDEDFYATPAWQTRALAERLRFQDRGGRYFEPCVGDGAIVRALNPALPFVTNDIVPRGDVVPDFLLDARQASSWHAFEAPGAIDVVVTNPPFDVAFAIAQHAYAAARRALILLLRLSWIEPTEERGPWLAAHPPTSVIVLPRTDYRKNGKTDSVTSAWVVWAKESELVLALRRRPIDVVTWRERDALIAAERLPAHV